MRNKGNKVNRRLKRKEFDYATVFDLAIASYKKETKDYLESKKDYCISQDQDFIKRATKQEYNLFQETIEHKEFNEFKDKMVKLYKEKFSNKKYSTLRDYYDEIKLLSPNNICPYCLKRTVKTLDHFLPKTVYPSLSISDANLIPSCRDCNLDKLNSNEVYINYYFEEIDDDYYMECYPDFSNNDVNFKFMLVKPSGWKEEKFTRLTKQFSETNILDYYGETAKIEYNRKERAFLRSVQNTHSYDDRLNDELNDLISDDSSTLSINSMEATLWRGLDKYGKDLFTYLSFKNKD